MVHGYERKEFHRLKRCLKVLKIYDQHQLFINSFFCCLCRGMTYNHVKDKIKILLTWVIIQLFFDE